MKHNPSLLENLSRSSMRLNKVLLVLLGIAILLVGFSYWAFQRLLREQNDTVRFHFARLMENVQRHEAFLREVAQQSVRGEMFYKGLNARYSARQLPTEGPNIYEGYEFPYSVPFGLSFNHQKLKESELPKVFTLGVHLSSLYSAFWSTSHYQSPQIFLYNDNDNFDITVPSNGVLHAGTKESEEPLNTIVARVARHLKVKNNGLADGRVHWEAYNVPDDYPRSTEMLAYINIQLDPNERKINGTSESSVVASLLNMNQVNDVERIMEWSIYDSFTLITPDGRAVIGSINSDRTLHEGLNINRNGMVFKVVAKTEQPWTAIYTISFKSYFGQLMWPLVGLLMLLLGGAGISWMISRWYRIRVVQPAEKAHQSIAESEAFSRAVIDTAPTGLCVVRRTDFKVLLENQRAQQWQGTAKLVAVLDRHHDLADVGETRLDIEGRHLHVGFISTRYQGQDVLLCAFNDITRHVQDALALEKARRTADLANQAKTRFLATMSHEIRTPLYGVLGTLELLGMTSLSARQEDYLQTIQRSSTTLFQLISDVLDVSKIESGQMLIESIGFCPLQLIEDTLHTYAAFAQRKGLLLCACTDPALPNRLQGDPVRIRQILNNLVSNAIKFTDSGRVVLRTRVLASDLDQVSVQWQVSDSGIGIAQAQQTQLFTPFFQVRDASSEAGAGLGLAICQRLCAMMNGELTVISEPGLGSSFSLDLRLKGLPGELTDCMDITPSPATVLVRAPVPELAENVCAWLNRFGLMARPLSDNLTVEPGAVLVDILPSDNVAAWQGSRIVCRINGLNQPETIADTPDVDLYDIRAIARAVSLVQKGKVVDATELARPAQTPLELRILVAEDNPINQAIIKEQLEALGCSVCVAANGEQALEQWRERAFDLVLTDVNMPVMNGYELAKALRKLDLRTPIIGVTANAMREEGTRCLEVGMNAWIVKPLSLKTLREQLLGFCSLPVEAVSVSEVSTSVHPESFDDNVVLSPRMRDIFSVTMREDLARLNSALDSTDMPGIAQRLHSIAGAMGAVQAGELAHACTELECRLSSGAVNATLLADVRQMVRRIQNLLDKVSP